MHSLTHPRRAPAQYGNVRHAQQRSTFSAIRSPKWPRGCACDQQFAFRIHESVARCTISHGVDQNLNGEWSGGRICQPFFDRRRGRSCTSRRSRVYETQIVHRKRNPLATSGSELLRMRSVVVRGARFHITWAFVSGASNCAAVATSGHLGQVLKV